MSTAPSDETSAPGSPRTHPITLVAGDGIGVEVVAAARAVLEATGVRFAWENADAGAVVFGRGIASGVPQETIDSVRRTGILFKGPLETPVGHGGKSANVTLRKLFETFANVRPVRELPGVPTRFSGCGVDMVVVRENVEDLYAGIEHMQTPGVAQCLKIITRKGCEKVIRLAFELARAEGRRRVHCATKANIMKLTEGLMKRVFEEIALEYPEIEARHIIVDNCAHQLAMRPEQFEVIVTTNLNGDILSDLCSALVGGLGFAPSVNLGHDVAIFEAVHGSAPDIAGQDIANPTAMILTGAMLLRHIGEMDAAASVEHALWLTLSEGKARTRDVARGEPAVGTRAFTDAVIANLGRPSPFRGRAYRRLTVPEIEPDPVAVVPDTRRATGIDVFIEAGGDADQLGVLLTRVAPDAGFHLKMISNRGAQVYPSRAGSTDCVDHWRCRFLALHPADDLNPLDVANLLSTLHRAGIRWMHIEKLQEFDDAPAYTKAQGED